MIKFLSENWVTVTTLFSGIGAWYYERNKRVQDVKSAELNNSEKIIEMYQQALDDLDKRFEMRIDTLEKDIVRLNSEVSDWKGKYSSLKKQFDDYKKKHQ